MQCKGVKHNKLICNTDINKTTCFGLLRGHHQVRQALWRHIYYTEFKLIDVDISSSISLFYAICGENCRVRSFAPYTHNGDASTQDHFSSALVRMHTSQPTTFNLKNQKLFTLCQCQIPPLANYP